MTVWRERISTLDGVVGTATCVLYGWVHIIGGRRGSGTVASTHRRWNPSTGQWEVLANLPAAREFATATVLGDGLIYVCGGRSGTANQAGVSSRLWRYNPATNTWAELSSMIYARAAAYGGVLDGRIFVAGGWASAGSTATMRTTVETYDRATGTWTERAPLPFSLRMAHGAAVYVLRHQAIHLLGGEGPDGTPVDYHLRYRFAQGWDARASLPAARRRHGGVGFDNRIWVAGAEDGDGTSVRVFDPDLNAWMLPNPTDLPEKRSRGSMAATGGRIEYIGGAVGEGAVLPNVIEYPYEPMFAPTLITFVAGEVIPQRGTQPLRWTNSSPNPMDVQSRFVWERRLIGSSVWASTDVTQTATEYQVPMSGLAVGNYEHRLRVYNQAHFSPWSQIETFTVAVIPTDVEITQPLPGGIINAEQYDIEWSTSSMTVAEIRRVADLNGQPDLDNIYETRTIIDPNARSERFTFSVPERFEHIQIRILRDGVWSDWESVRAYVSFVTPVPPTLTIIEDHDEGRISIIPGAPAVIPRVPWVTATAAPGGVLVEWGSAEDAEPEPAELEIVAVDIWREELDFLAYELGTIVPVDGSATWVGRTRINEVLHDYRVASRAHYRYRALAMAANGTSAYSDYYY